MTQKIKLKWLPTRANAGEVIDKSYWGDGDELLYTCAREPLASDFAEFPDWKRTTLDDILLTRNGTPYVHLPEPGSIYSNVVQRVSIPRVHRPYIRYALEAELAQFRGYGVSIESLNYEMWGNIKIFLPDRETQRAIAGFLDREAARIDQLVEKKAQLLGLIDQRFRNFAAHLTTRGMGAADLVSTGIDWNPLAPANWDVRRMADLFSESMELGGEDLPILSVSINTGISDRELGDEDRHRMVNHIEDRNAYKRVRAGDLVYNMMRAWQGGFGVAKVDGLVSPAYVVARPKVDLWAPYFEYVTRTPNCIEQFRRASKGIADFRQRLYWEHFRQVRIAIPPFSQQKQIADALDAEIARTEPIKTLTQQSIDRLREYRAALITAAVTGQIDVSENTRKGDTDRRLDTIEAEMRA